MFLTVYLSNSEQHFTEVPVTPETVCRDVVDLCKEPGESDCHLAEVWCGSGMRPTCALVLLSSVTHAYLQRNCRTACPSGGSSFTPALCDMKSFCCFLFLQQDEALLCKMWKGQDRWWMCNVEASGVLWSDVWCSVAVCLGFPSFRIWGILILLPSLSFFFFLVGF